MSEPTLGELLLMLAEWRETFDGYVYNEDHFKEQGLRERSNGLHDMVLDKLSPQHVRNLAAALATDAQAYWQAGFLRGAKWWEGQKEGATMWQSDQQAVLEAAADLWGKQRPEVTPPSYQAKFDADIAALAKAQP